MTRYATLANDMGGMDYRSIANTMIRDGEMLGHSTVRNVILRVMERFACTIMSQYGVWGDPAVIARDPDFQVCVAELVQDAVMARGRTSMHLPI